MGLKKQTLLLEHLMWYNIKKEGGRGDGKN